MSVLVSSCKTPCKTFSKELFTEVSDNIKILSDEEWKENKDPCKSVLFALYVRTDTDNLVITSDNKERFAQIYNPPLTQGSVVYPNLTFDLSLLCGKDLLDNIVTVNSEEALERLALNSTCFPVGALETSKNYVLVFNIIVKLDLITEDSEIKLNKGFYLNPIETLSFSDSLQSEIAKSLVKVSSDSQRVGDTMRDNRRLCNYCEFLSIDEDEQEEIMNNNNGGQFVPHICTKYRKRVMHFPYLQPDICPCEECDKENNIRRFSDE